MLRRKDKQMSEPEARHFLAEAPLVHLAGTGETGQPILRTFNMVPLGDALAFHAAPAGEKLEALGRPVVLQAEEVLTTVPSYWLHAEKACPATTLYRSVQATGMLEEVTALADKAAVLSALMARFQPEGGYRPLDPSLPMYRGPIAGLLVARFVLATIVGKLAVGQHRSPDERAKILAGLWTRGRPGDLRAFDLLVDAAPDVALPGPLAALAALGVRPRLVWSDAFRSDLAGLLAASRASPETELAREERTALAHDELEGKRFALFANELAAIARSTWIGIVDSQNRLVGSVRGLSDGRQHWLGAPLVAPHLDALRAPLTAALDAHPAMARAPFAPTAPAPRLEA